jgi:hypothetical protein
MGNVARQADDWPQGIDAEMKVRLTNAVREVLEEHGPLTLHRLLQLVKTKPIGWRPSPLWDAQEAAIERALRELNAEMVWRLTK